MARSENWLAIVFAWHASLKKRGLPPGGILSHPPASAKHDRVRQHSHPNVLIPKLWLLPDEFPHHFDAARVLQNFDFYSATAKQLLLTHKGLILPDDHARDAVEQDRA